MRLIKFLFAKSKDDQHHMLFIVGVDIDIETDEAIDSLDISYINSVIPNSVNAGYKIDYVVDPKTKHARNNCWIFRPPCIL